jgi:DNA-binding transcriptional LysR family regulator
MINLNHLRVFAAVAEEGNVTRAAARLSVSQPAVSKQLGDLERALDLRLCDRLPRGVRLTEAGRRLRSHAARLLAVEAAAEAEMAALVEGERGRLSVGASTTIGSYLVPELFGRFKRRHPEIDLELHIANTQAIQAALVGGSLDLALTEGFVGAATLEAEVVAHDEMKLIVPADHAFTRRRRVRVGDLSRVPMIMRERGSGSRDVIEAALSARGVRLEPAMSLGSTEAVKNAVAAGLGVAFVSELTVGQELRSARLAVVEIDGFSIPRALHLLRLRGRRASAAAAAFEALLRQSGDAGQYSSVSE